MEALYNVGNGTLTEGPILYGECEMFIIRRHVRRRFCRRGSTVKRKLEVSSDAAM
jgi:hypothetical protein